MANPPKPIAMHGWVAVTKDRQLVLPPDLALMLCDQNLEYMLETLKTFRSIGYLTGAVALA